MMAVRLAELLHPFDCGAISWHADQMRRSEMFICTELGPPLARTTPLRTSTPDYVTRSLAPHATPGSPRAVLFRS
jgi:hypothetical protein